MYGRKTPPTSFLFATHEIRSHHSSEKRGKRSSPKRLNQSTAQTQLPEHWSLWTTARRIARRKLSKITAHAFHGFRSFAVRAVRERHFAGKADARQHRIQILGNSRSLTSSEIWTPTSRSSRTSLEFLMQQFSEDKQLGVAGAPYNRKAIFDSARDSFEGREFCGRPSPVVSPPMFPGNRRLRAEPRGRRGLDRRDDGAGCLVGKQNRFAEKRFHHHRAMSTAERGILAAHFSYGQKDYYLGGSPLWEIFPSRLSRDEKTISYRRHRRFARLLPCGSMRNKNVPYRRN